MTLLVVSDTHGKAARLSEVVRRADPAAVLFLGDGVRDLLDLPDALPVRAVRGNCDIFAPDVPETRVEVFAGYRLFLTHGHRYGVKYSEESAVAAAAAANADALLYGHTHRPLERTLPAGTAVGGVTLSKPLLVLNPGSLGEPRDGKPSFATLTVTPAGLLAGFGTL